MRGANSIISDKIVETLASNGGNFEEKNDLHCSLLPTIQSCLVLFYIHFLVACENQIGSQPVYFLKVLL